MIQTMRFPSFRHLQRAVGIRPSLNQDVRINILHAGPGTLWIDLEKATLGELGGTAVLKQGR
ncbi:MAG: hypothetical protein P9F19_08290 [Candidatus Contendobacter sp.]|nr:hypothetical protein [Candidatus Contendobacter sp.]MDG4557370.1 hypothetical protein [Candidatus Contendobacter sp.]